MRSARPSLSIALFVGSVAAFACGGGDDDDGNRPLQTTDAAVIATQGGGATTGGVGASMDAGLGANASNPLANLDASGLINAALDSGLITTNPDGGIGINQGAICSIAPMYCVDGSLSIPRGDGGVRGPTGGTGGALAGLAGGTGGLAGLAGGLGGLAGLAGGLGGLAGLAGLAGGAGGGAAGGTTAP